ncbi:hypothetical protein [Gandjariella thermophila]|uniref:Uncharacterized protein n=1 Tax=Gandjariella thermophila TaxID=1931992 RepID=A0A4D4JC93_9PSEU|nr:hypothetical protein [Gandjariella thermophila]GDY31989.1 hypothetical protein GTS_36220 [Gandjariella thermophila]
MDMFDVVVVMLTRKGRAWVAGLLAAALVYFGVFVQANPRGYMGAAICVAAAVGAVGSVFIPQRWVSRTVSLASFGALIGGALIAGVVITFG